MEEGLEKFEWKQVSLFHRLYQEKSVGLFWTAFEGKDTKTGGFP